MNARMNHQFLAPQEINAGIGLRSILVPESGLQASIAALRGHGISPIVPPSIGAPWAGQGGLYVGIASGLNDPDYHLIVHPDCRRQISWYDAFDWAQAIGLEGHADYELPSMGELLLILANVRKHLERKRNQNPFFWTRDEHGDAKARSLWLGCGLNQGCEPKRCYIAFSCCAIRRVRA